MPSRPIARLDTARARRDVTRLLAGGLAILVILCVSPLVAGGESQVELTDGSVIVGELMTIEGGRYRIRSATLGEVSVPEADIRAVRPLASGAVSGASGAPGYGPEIAAIQQQLASDPGLTQQVMALQSDPAIQSVLSDPELTRLILAGDLETLRADPRIQRLMEHPSIQAILGRMVSH